MKELLTSSQIQEFLHDFKDTAKIEILEDAKEKNEIFEIAQARGINLKESKDLAGFKCIYCFADIPNKNKARLPKKALLKALPTLVGKPIDVDHIRNRVVGVLIDSRYILKDDSVVAYGILFKANFPEDWSEMEKKFKDGKLSVSYEIWCPQDKRKLHNDGTYSLEEQIIAGLAILDKEAPAFAKARVLEMAKEVKVSEDLVFASYNCEDIIVAGETIAPVKVDDTKPEPAPIIIPKIKCANCGHEFDAPKVATSEIKCSECFAIINEKGELLYPPQIIDFHISCIACSSRNWRLLKRDEVSAEIKCLSCAKKYKIEFAQMEKNDKLEMIQFIHVGSISCKQCGNTIVYSGSSKMKKYNLKCSKCGLEFSHDITHEQIKKITKINEIISEPLKASEELPSKADELNIDKSAIQSEEAKGEVTMEKQEEKAVEQAPVEAKVEETPKVEATPQAESVVAEAKPVEAKTEETPKVEEKKEDPKPTEAKVEEAPKAEEVVTEAKVEETSKVEEVKPEEKPTEAKVEPKEDKLNKYKDAVKRFAKKIKELKKEKNSLAKSSEEKIEFYKANAEEISKRRKELGEAGVELADVDIIDNKKYEDVKLAKINKELEQSSIVGTKVNEHDDTWYAQKRKEITEKAEGKIKRTK